MSYQYTPAAERALHSANGRVPRSQAELTPIYVLLGLLSEPECRAAKILEAQGIDEDAIRSAWPEAEVRDAIKPSGVAGVVRPLSAELENAFHSAILRLDENPRTCQLASEHLLLGLATDAGDVGSWLRNRGVDPEAMEAEICARYGIDHSPIPLAEVEFEVLKTPLVEASIGSSSLAIDDPAAELQIFGNQRPAASDDTFHLRSLRIVDASANRAGEALRVVEDYVRFGLNHRLLTDTCKRMRHDLAAALAPLPMHERLAARDTVGDVGTELTTPSEMTRTSLADVAAANVRRLQESLRSLEEFGKLIDPTMAARCEQLRYRAYTLQKQLDEAASLDDSHPPAPAIAARLTDDSPAAALRERISSAKLYVLLDGRDSEAAFTKLAHELIEAGVDVLQLRDKQFDDRTLLARARLLREATHIANRSGRYALFIMNDRPDLALLAEADGVHLGQEELTVAEARRILGPTPLIGISTHDIDQARAAVADGADYLGLGPTFPSTTKQFDTFPGVAFLREAAAEIKIPTFAIGGITPDNIAEVRAAGIHRVAMSGAILNAAELPIVVEKSKAALIHSVNQAQSEF
jgi:thiamine-phosphate pyrophosphorylase